jgi:hypothetical protein
MTSSNQNSMDMLNALMEERNRYEQWLAQLEARKASTPPHVFERVRNDYAERLKSVLDQLSGRASELQATATSLADRVASLFADETALRDERAEAELRASVGEFTLEHAQAVMQRCDEAIASIGAQRASVGAELGRVQEILAVAARPVTPPAGEAPVVPIESLAPPPPGPPPAPRRVPVSAVTAADAPAVPVNGGAGIADSPASFDELAFLHSVVDKPAVSSPAELHPPTPELPADLRAPAAERGPTGSGPSVDDRAPAPEVVAAGNGAQTRRSAAPTPVLTSAPLVEKQGQEQNSTLTPGSIPAFLKDVPTEQIKTLKCQECGTMNYPTEWYCERCGGELAAM